MLDQTQRLWKTWGEYFNYPSCCIKAFINKESKEYILENSPFYQSGFIPCKHCYGKVVNMSIEQANLSLGINVKHTTSNAVDLYKTTLKETSTDKFKEIANKNKLDLKGYSNFLTMELERLEKVS